MVGVGQEIRDHMMQLRGVRQNGWHLLVQLEMHGNAVQGEGMPQQDEHVANDGIERHGLARRRLLPGQGQKALHHTLAALDRLAQCLEGLRRRGGAPLFVQVVELQRRHGQGIVEFVGHIGQQGP
jgi:hypothetical protein